MKKTIFGIAALTLVACGNADPTETAFDVAPATNPVQTASYQSYCFKRVGQIGGEPRRGEACDADGGGAGGRMEALARPERNNVSVNIASPSLEAIGVGAVSFNLNRGAGAPKFSTGVHVMDQVRLTDEEMDPLDMPDRLAFASDVTGKEALFSWTMPDAAILRAGAPDFDFPGYEIASATLIIDKAVDLPVDEEAAVMQKAFGMTTGEQYIEGTLNISLIPMGSKGEQFGPAIFEFGATIGWGYTK